MSKMPWEMSPEEVRKASGAEVPAAEIKQETNKNKMPWEMSFEEIRAFFKPKPKTPIPSPVKDPVEPSKTPPAPLPNEAAMKKATADLFTPAANAKRKAQESSAKNIAELQAEIDRTKDPAQKKILMDYMKSLVGGSISFQERADPLIAADKTVPGLNKELDSLVKTTRSIPEFQSMENFLQSRNAVPKFEFEYNPGNKGSFEKSGVADPGIIRVSAYQTPEGFTAGAQGTLLHETTHAVDYELSRLANEIRAMKNPSSLEKQFADAYKKTFDTGFSIGEAGRIRPEDRIAGSQKLARALDSKWFNENREYRTRSSELASHATGEVLGDATPNKGHEAPKHMNPSLVSEFMMVLDLAKKVMKVRGNNG